MPLVLLHSSLLRASQPPCALLPPPHSLLLASSGFSILLLFPLLPPRKYCCSIFFFSVIPFPVLLPFSFFCISFFFFFFLLFFFFCFFALHVASILSSLYYCIFVVFSGSLFTIAWSTHSLFNNIARINTKLSDDELVAAETTLQVSGFLTLQLNELLAFLYDIWSASFEYITAMLNPASTHGPQETWR